MPVDKFHTLQMKYAAALALFCIGLYFVAPPSKSELLAGLSTMLIGFMVGKFSNGFKGRNRSNSEAAEQAIVEEREPQELRIQRAEGILQ